MPVNQRANPRASTLFVAASDSAPRSKRGADYICDGTADQVEINAAITALSSTGGVVRLSEGTFNIAADVTPTSNIIITGSGIATILKAVASTSANCIKIDTASNVVVEDLQIDGNKANVNDIGIQYILLNGIYITASDNVHVRGCYVHDHYAGGILADSSTDLFITNNRIEDGTDNGIFLRPLTTNDGVVNATISNNIVSGMGYSGIQAIRSQYLTIANNVSFSNGPSDAQGDGVGVEGCSYVTISGNVVYSNAIQGISVRPTDEGGTTIGSDHVVVTGNVSYNHTSTNGDAGGIVITASDDVLVSNNSVSGNYYGINICESHSLTSGDITFLSNRVFDNTDLGIRIGVTSTPTLLLNDNHVYNNASHNLYTNASVQVQGGVYSGATGAGHNGIYLDTGASDSFISGAYIYDNADNGILTNTSVTGVEIKGCYFDNIAGSSQGRALYEVTGPTRLIGNRITNQSNEDYHFTSGSSVFSDEVPTSVSGNAGTATALATARAIYGNNFDGTAALTQIIASTYGGTGNGFTKFTGPTTSEKTFTLPDASSTLLYSGGALGTPSSGTVTNLTGTASININGTVGATTPTTATFTTATINTGVALAENASVMLDPAGSADGKYSGITVTGTGGATIAFGDLVTLDKDDSRWELVDISVAAAATGDARGVIGVAVTSSTDGNPITVLLHGIVRADANFPTLTIGAPVYASTTGDVVVTQPTTTDHIIRIVGFGLTADEMYFNPDNSYITHT